MPRVTRLLQARFTTSLHALVRALPLRDLLPLAAAIALLFSVLGPVGDILKGGRQPLPLVAGNSVVAMAVALGYAFGSMRRNTLLLAGTALGNIVWAVTARRFSAETSLLPASAAAGRLNADASGILLAIAGSYTCFLWFMNGTAARYLRVRAEIDLARTIHEVLVPAIDVRHSGS